MTTDEPFLSGIANIRAAILEQLQATGTQVDQLNLLPAEFDEPPHEIIFNVYASGRARSMTITQTKIIEAAATVTDIELLRAIADLVSQLRAP